MIVVPPGQVRHQAARNEQCLNFARGQIIGIYDAEDAPEPAQLRKVAAAFAHAVPRWPACKAFWITYNTGTNWIVALLHARNMRRGFAISLPGLSRLALWFRRRVTTLFTPPSMCCVLWAAGMPTT